MRETAADAGLSPAFFDEQEGSWEEEESTWADKAGEIIATLPLVFFHAFRELAVSRNG